ncbi:MAG: PH domain-containing protein [Geminicoccaceae bacterium]
MKVLEPSMIFPGEKIVHVTGYHWIYVLRAFLPLALVLIIGTVAWALMPSQATSLIIMIALIASMVWIVVRYLDTVVKRCYVTDRRLINRSGWTKRDTQDVTLDRIGGIFLDQTPMERFFGYGRIRLIVPVIQIPLPEYLRNPIAFRNAIYLKPVAKEPEKPDDDVLEAAEHDRVAAEKDDRFGTETVSLKDLRETVEDLDEHSLGADMGGEFGTDTSTEFGTDTSDNFAEATDTAELAEADAGLDGTDDGSGGADGGEDT